MHSFVSLVYIFKGKSWDKFQEEPNLQAGWPFGVDTFVKVLEDF